MTRPVPRQFLNQTETRCLPLWFQNTLITKKGVCAWVCCCCGDKCVNKQRVSYWYEWNILSSTVSFGNPNFPNFPYSLPCSRRGMEWARHPLLIVCNSPLIVSRTGGSRANAACYSSPVDSRPWKPAMLTTLLARAGNRDLDIFFPGSADCWNFMP